MIKFVNKIKFDKLFYIFILLCKQWQFSLIKFKNILFLLNFCVDILCILRKFFFCYYLKWLNCKDFNLYVNLKVNDFNGYDFSCLYTLYIVEYLYYDIRLLNINSKFFLKNFKNLINYKEFKLRLPFFWYASLNNYCEYFRFVKYSEYIKRYDFKIYDKPYLKWLRKYRKKFNFGKFTRMQSLTKHYRFNLMFDSYLFYNSSVIGHKHYNTGLYLELQMLLKNQFLILQSFFFFNNLLLIYCFNILKKFFKIWIIRFIYNFFMKFGGQFLQRFKYRNISHLSSFFILIRFDYIKYILWYYYRKVYLTVFEKLNVNIFFNKSLWRYNYNFGWLSVIDVALYELIHEVLYLRILDQFERDMIAPLSSLFLSLWVLFVEFYYFDVTFLDIPYLKLEEFNVWSSLVKYNLEILICSIFNSQFLSLVNLNKVKSVNRSIKLIKASTKVLYKLFWKNQIMLYKHKGNIIFFCFQINNLIFKLNYYYIYDFVKFRQFKLLQYKEMLLNNGNIILFLKYIRYREFCKLYFNEYDNDICTTLPM